MSGVALAATASAAVCEAVRCDWLFFWRFRGAGVFAGAGVWEGVGVRCSIESYTAGLPGAGDRLHESAVSERSERSVAAVEAWRWKPCGGGVGGGGIEPPSTADKEGSVGIAMAVLDRVVSVYLTLQHQQHLHRRRASTTRQATTCI